MNNWPQLDWDLDDAQTALNAARTAKHKDENKAAIVHLENVIFSAKEEKKKLERVKRIQKERTQVVEAEDALARKMNE